MRTLHGAAALAVLASGAALGCGGYTSSYVPPTDGRARVLWEGDRAVASIPAVGKSCTPPPPAEPAGESTSAPTVIVHGGFWVPRYYGPPILIVSGQSAPPLRVSARSAAAPAIVHGTSTAVSGAGFLGRTGSFGKGGDSGKLALVALAVAVLAVLPAAAVGLSVASPEPADVVSQVVDEVNAYNDAARAEGSPCAAPLSVEVP